MDARHDGSDPPDGPAGIPDLERGAANGHDDGRCEPERHPSAEGDLQHGCDVRRDPRLSARVPNRHAETAADGWTQRLRLMSVKGVTIEEQSDGSSIVVATYAWLAAASNN